MKKIFLLSTLSFLTFTSGAFAADKFEFDKAHTNILMSINHLGFSNMILEALDYEGSIMFDKDNFEDSSVEITFKATGIDGDHDGFEQHLQSADFFNVAEFPEITFKSTAAKTTGENTFDVMGDVTLLGITKPLTLNVVFNKEGENPFSKKHTAGFSATATVKRSEFGMNYGVPMIGDDVNFAIEVEAIKSEE